MWLSFIIHLFIGTTFAGSAVIAALLAGFDHMNGILIAAALGYVVGVPATWIVARKLGGLS